MTTPSKYPELTWTKNEYVHVQQALTILKDIIAREDKRHEMDQHLTPSMYSLLTNEIIPMLDNEIDVDYSDDEITEPPMTADEMHTAAWQQHQEMHS